MLPHCLHRPSQDGLNDGFLGVVPKEEGCPKKMDGVGVMRKKVVQSKKIPSNRSHQWRHPKEVAKVFLRACACWIDLAREDGSCDAEEEVLVHCCCV